MAGKHSAEEIAVIDQQLSALRPIIDKAKQLYNSNFLTVSVWITAEKDNQPFQEILHFSSQETVIPPHFKAFFSDYLVFLVSLQQSLTKQLPKSIIKGQRDCEPIPA